MASSETPAVGTDSNSQQPQQAIQVEFAINFDSPADLTIIDDALKTKGLKMAAANIEEKTIHIEIKIGEQNVELGHDVHQLQELIERQTGFITVIKGLGQLRSAVAELRPPPQLTSPSSGETNYVRQVFGVVRLSQMTNGFCFVDGLIEVTNDDHRLARPLSRLRYSIAIHEFGDLSGRAYESIGDPIVTLMEQTVDIDEQNDEKTIPILRVSRIVPDTDVASMIGRSIAITETTNTNNSVSQTGTILSAGVIARASTIGFNRKKFCACSGKTLWEERLSERQNNS